MISDEQKEQIELAKYYNTQIWAIPSISFGLVGLVFQALDRDPFVGLWNLVILITTAVFSFCLLLLFNKTHFQQLRLKSYVKREENGEEDLSKKRSTFFSLSPSEVIRESQRLKGEGENITFTQEFLAKRKTVLWVRRIICLIITTNAGIAIYILIKLLIPIIKIS